MMDSLLKDYGQELKKDFEKTKRLLSFNEYLDLILEVPSAHLRGSSQYLLDAIDSFGAAQTDHGLRHKIFDMEFADPKHRVVGQIASQNEIYNTLKSFVKEGVNNKLVLLHGPNGSAKSSMIHCLMKGLEHYSQKTEGALYKFNWIFPVDKYQKTGFGLTASGGKELESYAKLPDDEIQSRITCDLKDHPLLLLPTELRNRFLDKCNAKIGAGKTLALPDYLARGALSHKSHLIFEALMTRYKGDLTRVLMHVQVERFYVSKRYRTAAVTIEPQMHVDGGSRQISADRSLAYLPPSLQYLSLYELMGDLPEGNRGIVDFADLLKRPVDTFKYLLIACEQGAINIGTTQVSLDLIFMGSTNEIQLDAFKEFPDFTSFKARIELIRVPYILEYSEEQKIYDIQIKKTAGEKHISPHTTFVAALWAVLTRLKKPNPSNFPSNLTEVIAALTPLDKAKLYDHAEMPPLVSPEQKKYLKAAIPRIREEYNSVPYYEGRVGASAREVKSILHDAAQNADSVCLTALTVFKELEQFVKRVTEYEFLKQDVRDGYHDAYEFINTVRSEYLSLLDLEVRESMGLFEKTQYEDYLKKYILHLSHLLKAERIKNPITGKLEQPDERLISDFEQIVDAPQNGKDLEAFRHNVIAAIGAYSLDHPKQPMQYGQVFTDFMKKLANHYFEEQRSQMMVLNNALSTFGTDKEDHASDAAKLARLTIKNMKERFHYCDDCAKNSILFLVKTKY